jgi:hypothetical protein
MAGNAAYPLESVFQMTAFEVILEFRLDILGQRPTLCGCYYSRQAITGGRDIDDWCAWAMDQANRLDPMVFSPPSVLDDKDQFFWH